MTLDCPWWLPGVVAIALAGCGGAGTTSNEKPSVSISVSATSPLTAGATIRLTASALDVDGTISSYQWTQISGTSVELSSATIAAPTFVAPVGVSAQSLVFNVVVTDNDGATGSTSVSMSVAAGVAAPVNFWMRNVGTNAVTNWDAVDHASTYNLYMATESFASLSSLSSYATLTDGYLFPDITSAPATPYQLTGLETGTRYYFVVTAVCSAAVCGTRTESVASAEITRLIGQTFPFTQALQDTTLETCIGTDGEWTDCPADGLSGQDAQYGRTAGALAGTLSKTGSGVAAMDFTLLDEDGAIVTDSSAAHCLKDNHSGLIWELKNADDIVRTDGNRFSWYSAVATTNGGQAGLYYGSECSGDVCNTASYNNYLDGLALCGRTDWRLPTVAELRGVSDVGGLCDEDDACLYDTHAWYWSADSWAGDATQAWIVSLDGRPDTPYSKELPRQVMMVSDGGSQ